MISDVQSAQCLENCLRKYCRSLSKDIKNKQTNFFLYDQHPRQIILHLVAFYFFWRRNKGALSARQFLQHAQVSIDIIPQTGWPLWSPPCVDALLIPYQRPSLSRQLAIGILVDLPTRAKESLTTFRSARFTPIVAATSSTSWNIQIRKCCLWLVHWFILTLSMTACDPNKGTSL